uniref:Ig-like domain-containing protein n=1 Tax=Cynoglossus semilaevis TaxID=244447 RepID=A0A3P8VMI5_CYNSE
MSAHKSNCAAQTHCGYNCGLWRVYQPVSEVLTGLWGTALTAASAEYMLFLCPKMNPLEKVALEGKNVSLVCKVNQARIQKVQWYRKEMAGEYNVLIQDSGDRDDPNLSGLKGRVTLADNGSSLTISKAEMKDGGEYWCIVLGACHHRCYISNCGFYVKT